MKKAIFILPIIILIAVYNSCSEDWIHEDVEPQGEFLSANYYLNDAQTLNALNGAMQYMRAQFGATALQGWNYCSWHFLSCFPSDNVHPGGGGIADLPVLQDLGEYDWTAENNALYYFWQKSYFGITRCNAILELPQYSSDLLTQYQAQARFLRGLFHFQLVQLFGNVVAADHLFTSLEKEIGRSTYIELFDLITSDFKAAANVLPEKSEQEAINLNRPCRGAALAYLGKAYLFMASPHYTDFGNEYYDSAVVALQHVISSDEYQLETNYDDIWQLSHEYGVESIFEVEYNGTNTLDGFSHMLWASGNLDVQMGGVRNCNSCDSIASGSWGWSIPTANLISAYRSEDDDVRLNGTVLLFNQLTGSEGMSFNTPETFGGGWSKKRMAWQHIQYEENRQTGYPTNERYMRYADVLLMYSEALLQSGMADPLNNNADHYLNLVRQRAQLDPKTNITLDDIKLERRLELAFEGQRFHDLVRWSQPDASDLIEIINAFREAEGQTTIIKEFEAKHVDYPIPASEVVASDGNLDNPDY